MKSSLRRAFFYAAVPLAYRDKVTVRKKAHFLP
jgi:hypothetical protein